jgi:hypothetical protein
VCGRFEHTDLPRHAAHAADVELGTLLSVQPLVLGAL